MSVVIEILGNRVIQAAALAWAIAQGMKVILTLIISKRFDSTRVFGSGGMPSSHTATVAALCTSCAIGEGIDSAVFAISVVLAIIVMIDATGVRRETGKQSRALNIIVEELFKSNEKTFDTHFKELIGHTPLQVVFGFITGMVAALALSFVPAFGVSFL